MNNEVSDFEVLDNLARKDRITVFSRLLGGNVRKDGAELRFLVTLEAMESAIKESHYFILYAVKKEDFNFKKSELEQKKASKKSVK